MQLFKILTVFLFIPLFASSQTSINSGWVEHTNGITVSYSIGQTFYKSQEEEWQDLILIAYRGIHIPFERFANSTENNHLDPNIIIFPNPTSDYISVISPKINSISYSIISPLGQILKRGNITQTTTQFDLSIYPAGVYLINIYQESSNLSKYFKVIKL
jgi:hypothetical protein